MLALGIPFLPCQIDNFRVVFSFLLFSVPLGAGLSLSLSLSSPLLLYGFEARNRMSFENATKAPRDENHGTRACFPFFHDICVPERAEETGRCRSSTLFTPPVQLPAIIFFSQGENFPGRTVVYVTVSWRNAIVWKKTRRARTLGDSTSTQLVGHFGRWNGSSFEEVGLGPSRGRKKKKNAWGALCSVRNNGSIHDATRYRSILQSAARHNGIVTRQKWTEPEKSPVKIIWTIPCLVHGTYSQWYKYYNTSSVSTLLGNASTTWDFRLPGLIISPVKLTPVES